MKGPMSESKKSSQSIQQEYNQLAFRAGNLQYAIRENSKDLDLLNSQMRDLSLEYISVQAEEQKAADAAKAQEAPKLEAVPEPQPASGAV